MNTKKSLGYGTSFFLPVIISLAITRTHAATISTCDEDGLHAAVTAGGTYTFDCNATISLTGTLLVTKDTILDAVGHNVTISGNHVVRAFKVSPGISLTLLNLTIANGTHIGTNGVFGESLSANHSKHCWRTCIRRSNLQQ